MSWPAHRRSSRHCRRCSPHLRHTATPMGCSGRFRTGTGWLHILSSYLQREKGGACLTIVYFCFLVQTKQSALSCCYFSTNGLKQNWLCLGKSYKTPQSDCGDASAAPVVSISSFLFIHSHPVNTDIRSHTRTNEEKEQIQPVFLKNKKVKKERLEQKSCG